MNNSRPIYSPTKAQIRAACREIQKEWSAEEELRHRAIKSPESVEVKRVRTGETEPGISHQIHRFLNTGADSGR